jgi:hypothetical protein
VADIKRERVLSLTTPTGFRRPGGGGPPVNTTRAERASGPTVRMGVRKWPARRHPIILNHTATQGREGQSIAARVYLRPASPVSAGRWKT